jgi:dolichol kinase
MEREEYKRKAIHIGMGLWAFFPLIVTRYYALFICAIFLLLVLFVFREHRWKSVFDVMARQEDYTHGYLMGPLIYILAVMVCVGFYPPYIAAASFAIMAFGDGFATIVGRNVGIHRYPYSEKSIEGTAGFIVCGFLSTLVVLIILTHFVSFQGLANTAPGYLATIALIGSVCGAAVETLPFEKSRGTSIIRRTFIDDNFFVPVVSGLIMTVFVIL